MAMTNPTSIVPHKTTGRKRMPGISYAGLKSPEILTISGIFFQSFSKTREKFA
jgi:hypothetical protein